MKLYRFTSTQVLPITRRQAWRFFSSPSNLVVVTPRNLNLRIEPGSDYGILRAGQVIGLSMTVFSLFKIDWRMAVAEVNDLSHFTDIQLAGPFSRWTHKHIFNEVSGGTEITDEIEYAMPFGILGRFANFVFVRRELEKLFDYRLQMLNACLQK